MILIAVRLISKELQEEIYIDRIECKEFGKKLLLITILIQSTTNVSINFHSAYKLPALQLYEYLC